MLHTSTAVVSCVTVAEEKSAFVSPPRALLHASGVAACSRFLKDGKQYGV